MSYLLDTEFLKSLFSRNQRENYVKVTSLNIDETPRETLEGKVTQGNINIDGKSAVRRTCNLTFATTEGTSINEYYWALNTKFKLEVGINNDINPKYPKVVYFPMGIYVIASFNLSRTTNSFTCSIQGKDKMCLLNGDVSGQIFANSDFGTIDIIKQTATGIKPEKDRVDIPIDQVIKNIIHTYANEPYQNIIVKDIPKYGKFLYKFNGDSTVKAMYAYTRIEESDFTDKTVEARATDIKKDMISFNEVVNIDYGENNKAIKVKVIPQEMWVNGEWQEVAAQTIDINTASPQVTTVSGVQTGFVFYDSNLPMNEVEDEQLRNANPTKIMYGDSIECVVTKVLPGQPAGYKLTELTFPRKAGDESSGLIVGVGQAVTAALDKIVETLGDYEYFYNTEGQFVFQKRNSHIDTNWKTNIFELNYSNGVANMNALPVNYWDYGNGELLLSCNNNPTLGNIKNDFAIWGKDSNDLPIHLRYAIDTKPMEYNTIKVTQKEADAFMKEHPEILNVVPQESKHYVTEGETHVIGTNSNVVDWREVIFQMASDYLKYNHFDSFEAKVRDANPTLYPTGKTGYEQQYTDIQSFWRELYKPIDIFEVFKDNDYKQIEKLNTTPKATDASQLEKEIQVWGHYESADKETANAVICYDANGPYVVPLGESRQTELNKGLSNKKYFCVKQGNKDEGQQFTAQFIDPYFGYEGDTYIDFSEKTNYIYTYKKGRWPYIENNNKIGDYDLIMAETIMSEHMREDIFNYNYNSFQPHDENSEITFFQNYDFYTCYIENGIKQVLVSIYSDIEKKWLLELKPISDKIYYKRDMNGMISRATAQDNLNGLYEYNGTEKYGDFMKPVMIPINDLDNLELTEKHEYVYIDRSERSYGLLSKMPRYLLNLFVSNGNIFDKKKYLSTMRFAERSASGDLTGETFNKTNYFYQDENNNLNGWLGEEKNPETLKFWFDFLDSPSSEIGKMSVKNIMSRTNSMNDEAIKAIYYRECLRLYLLYREEDEMSEEAKKILAEQTRVLPYVEKSYSRYIFKDNKEEKYFDILNVGKSCKEVLDQQVYKYTYASNTISVTSIPIYHLQPGDVISLVNKEAMVEGNYIINSISIPLTYNGTMNINATKQIQTLY